MDRVIDAHLHLSERKDDLLTSYAKKNRLRYTLEELIGTMKRHHVGQGLLLSPPMQDGSPLPNEEIIALCRRSGGMLLPAVTVEPSKSAVRAALRLAEENRERVKAFKVRLGYSKTSASSPILEEAYDYAETEGLPVLFHTGDTATTNGDLMSSHPLTLDRLANRREEMTIVLCHFGNPWFDDVAEMIYKHPKVYADISGLTTGGGGYAEKFSRWLARKISEAIYFSGGAEKVIFGTDYPVTKVSDALHLVDLLDLTDADKQKILRLNARKVYDL